MITQRRSDAAWRELARSPAAIATAYGVGFFVLQILVGVLLAGLGPGRNTTMESLAWMLLITAPFALALWVLVFCMRRRRPLQSPGLTALYAIAFTVVIFALSVATWVMVSGIRLQDWGYLLLAVFAYTTPVAIAISATAITIGVLEVLFPVTERTLRNRLRDREAFESWSDERWDDER